MKYINLKWAKSEDDGKFNLEMICSYIINKLTGKEVRYFHFVIPGE